MSIHAETPMAAEAVTAGDTGGDVSLVTDVRNLDAIAEEYGAFRQLDEGDTHQTLPEEPEPRSDAPERTDSIKAEQAEGRLSVSARSVLDASPERLAQDEQLGRKLVVRLGSGPEDYLQEISDQARDRDLGYISEGDVPVSRDHYQGTVAAVDAAMQRLKDHETEGKPCTPVICDVGTDNGHQGQATLEHVKERYPEIYQREDFKVVV